jgi:serine/threonine-protein kinase HipA
MEILAFCQERANNMAFEPVNSIEVVCWDKPVGVLAFDSRYDVYAFEYYEAFRQSGWELSPLLLPLSTRGAVVFPNLSRETYFGLPAFIADSLPDAFGNMLIDSWMAAQGVSRHQITALDRLAYLGKRAMGALEFRPALQRDNMTSSALEMANLVEAARQALVINLRQDEQNPEIKLISAGQSAEQTKLSLLIDIGTSAGGARAKAVVGYNPATDDFISGQFALSEGYEPWIIKFDLAEPDETPEPGHKQAYGRIEYAYHLMALDCGIDMQPCRLYQADGRAHFMTRRFDRTVSGEKLHLQTLCALAALDFNLRDTHDYNQAFMTIEELGLDYSATDELFRRMVFNVAMANNDDHTKNLSFIMASDGLWHLAPAYDLIHAFNPQGLWTSRHLMAVNGKRSDITRDDLMDVARRYHVSAPADIIDTVIDVATRWPDYAESAGVPGGSIEIVQNDIDFFAELLRPVL